ncbi:WcaF family extracellular polysaccharide biosynthesis acetyltransferase [Camelimonas abortus]|uniref:WcaF family extracellular polysaccharide biosynthesis acetyltransferase n=1 Tax=Camelimonas abortus TaxID=1017184 RepID=A0ABV7LDZ6_9HYPH
MDQPATVAPAAGDHMTRQDLRLFRTPAGFRGRSLAAVACWRLAQGSLFAWSPPPLHGWRRALLRLFGARIGRGVRILPSARVAYPWKLEIGDHAWVGADAVIYNLAPVRIGAHAVISQRSCLCAAGHALDRQDFAYVTAPIHVGPQAWICMDVWVAPGVSIGAGAVVGARASVFHDIPPGVVATGAPARPRRLRPPPRTGAAGDAGPHGRGRP